MYNVGIFVYLWMRLFILSSYFIDFFSPTDNETRNEETEGEEEEEAQAQERAREEDAVSEAGIV